MHFERFVRCRSRRAHVNFSPYFALQNSDTESLRDIAEIMSDSDVSPFEIIHSGLVEKLLTYITVSDPQLRDLRLRKFLHVFLGCPVSISLPNYVIYGSENSSMSSSAAP